MRVPAFMLKKLYVKGSLAASEDGFVFHMRNTLAKASLIEPPELALDDEPIHGESVTFVVDGEQAEGSTLSADTPFVLAKDADAEVRVSGTELSAGTHKLRIRVASKEWDVIEFEVEDTV